MFRFLVFCAAAAGCRLAAADGTSMTALEVIEKIRSKSGVTWRKETVDTFKAGNPDTRVTGIATTFTATLDVLERAAASGKNLVITHEPTFYNHLDTTGDLKGDPTYEAKQAFIAGHNMVVWRFHDHIHQMKPDPVLHALAVKLGWLGYADAGNPAVFTIPEASLADLSSSLKSRLALRAVRVIGDPAMKVKRVAIVPGAAPTSMQMGMLRRDDVQVLVAGESREWETVEYARDGGTAGKGKALILLGHVPSEEPGMEECAAWLKTFLQGIPIEFIPAREPFWTPK